MKDIIGKALLAYLGGDTSEDILTATNISSEDVLPLTYLFRDFEHMPKLEQHALSLCKGNILDVGCGAGSHSLHLQNNNLQVKAIDTSPGAIEVCRLRGVTNAHQLDVLDETGTFDTILLLMNGTGIFQKLYLVEKYLSHLKSLITPRGQILIDSSDIRYMYENEDGSYDLDLNADYYGELDYFISYKGEKEMPMTWLYLDFERLHQACNLVGLQCELLLQGPHYDYLARLSHH